METPKAQAFLDKKHSSGILAVALAAFLWSTGGIGIRLLPYDSLVIAGLRSAFAALTFLLIFRSTVIKWNRWTFIGALAYASVLFLFVTATKLTTVANAIFLQYTAPIYVLLAEPKFFGTSLRRIDVLAVFGCFVGMALFFAPSLLGSSEVSINNTSLGDICALASGVALAVFFLVQRKSGETSAPAAIFWGNTLLSVCCFLPISQAVPDFTNMHWAVIVFLGVVQIGLAYAIFSYGLARISALESSLVAMIEPVLSPVWVFFLHGEIPHFFSIIGGIVIITVLISRSIFHNRHAQAFTKKL